MWSPLIRALSLLMGSTLGTCIIHGIIIFSSEDKHWLYDVPGVLAFKDCFYIEDRIMTFVVW